MPHRLTLALTGASGMPYALGLLKALVARRQAVTLLITDAAREVLRLEHDLIIPAEQDLSRPSGKALLILFPCFPCDAADTRSESPITDQSTATYL